MTKNSKANEAKVQNAYAIGEKCGYHGFAPSTYTAQIASFGKEENAAFQQGMYAGFMRKKKELADAKR